MLLKVIAVIGLTLLILVPTLCVSECEKAAYAGLTHEQKTSICSEGEGIGPALCSVAAKGLHLSTKEIVNLCKGAVGTSPVECLRAIPSRFRKMYGDQLCPNHVSTTAPGKCFATITGFKGAHLIKPTEAVTFCENLDEDGPIACMQAIVESGVQPQLLNAKMGLDNDMGCRRSTLYYSRFIPGEQGRLVRDVVTGKPYNPNQKRSLVKAVLDTFRFWKPSKTNGDGIGVGSAEGKKLAITACLQELKHALAGAAPKDYRLRPPELLRFCMHTSVLSLAPQSAKENFFSEGHRLESVKYNKTGGVPEYFRSYAAECVVHAIDLGERGKTQPFFNSTERLQLCEDVDCRKGPTNCAKIVLYKNGAGAISPASLITLCNGACGIDHESSRVIRYEARFEERRILRTRSRNKRVRQHAQRQANTELYHRLAESSRRLGLGPALCFNEALRSVKGNEARVELCVGAESGGPAQCYGRTRAVPGMHEHQDKLNLCVGASGEEPAMCVLDSPGYLELEEKIQLCAGAKVGSHSEPISCLRKIEGPSKLLRGAPKHSVGAMVGMLRGDRGSLRARELLVHMCSAGGSINPLASAACLKSAPLQLEHDDVVRACTNVSNSEVLSKVRLCAKLLPVDWSFTEAMRLCAWEPPSIIDPDNENATISEREKWDNRDGSVSSTHTTVQCALEVSRQRVYADDGKQTYWTKQEVSELCKKENDAGAVRRCALAVQPSVAASAAHNAQFLTAGTITSICDDAKDDGPGKCLTRLNAVTSQRKVTLAPGEDVPEEICNSNDPMFALSCLDDVMRKSNVLSRSHVEECFSQPRRVDSARVKTIKSIDGAPVPTAGVSFSLSVALIDQFGTEFESYGEGLDEEGDGSDEEECEVAGKILSISLDEGNEQGAVLWGIRSNKTTCDTFHLASLVISQPGQVQVKIAYASGSVADKEKLGPAGGVALAMFYLNVLPDPAFGSSTGLCTFIFREGMTGSSQLPSSIAVVGRGGADEDDGQIRHISAGDDAGPAMIRSYIPSFHYLKVIYCANIMHKWHVSAFNTSHGFWIEYRNGVDAIWTGRGLPKYEQSFEERLGLTPGVLEEAMQLSHETFQEFEGARSRRGATEGSEGAKGNSFAPAVDGNTTTVTETVPPENNSTVSNITETTMNGNAGETLVSEGVETEAAEGGGDDDSTDVIAAIEEAEERELQEGRQKAEEVRREKLSKQYDIDARFRFSRKCNVSLEELNKTVNGTISKMAIEKCSLDAVETEEDKQKIEAEKEAWVLSMKLKMERSANRTREAEKILQEKRDAVAFERDQLAAKKKKLVKMERQAQKILRKAYYAKSIRWHPDRWVGLKTYAEVVKDTFEAVTEAYDGLQAMITELGRQNLADFMAREEARKKQQSTQGGAGDKDDNGTDGAEGNPIIPEAQDAPTPSTSPELFS
jgi:hypothetical protein